MSTNNTELNEEAASRSDGVESGFDEPAKTESGLDENVAGALSYLFGAITGIVFLVADKENEFVRFHAAQSIAFSVAVFLASVVLSFLTALLPFLVLGDAFATGGLVAGLVGLALGLVGLVLSLGAFALWILLMVRAYQGKRIRIPVIAGLADKLA